MRGLVLFLTATVVVAWGNSLSLKAPPQWEKGFWFGYEAGRRSVLKDERLLEEILLIKEEILRSKIPPIVIEGGRCIVVDKSFLKRFSPSPKLLPGYYVVVDTSELTTTQKYYLLYKLKQLGLNAYDRGSIYVGSFPSERDAEVYQSEIERSFGVSSFITKVEN